MLKDRDGGNQPKVICSVHFPALSFIPSSVSFVTQLQVVSILPAKKKLERKMEAGREEERKMVREMSD